MKKTARILALTMTLLAIAPFAMAEGVVSTSTVGSITISSEEGDILEITIPSDTGETEMALLAEKLNAIEPSGAR